MSDKVEKALQTIASELRHAEDTLDDLRARLQTWGFSMLPSEERLMRERIDAAELRVKQCERAATVLNPEL